jgi:hypothetical protein
VVSDLFQVVVPVESAASGAPALESRLRRQNALELIARLVRGHYDGAAVADRGDRDERLRTLALLHAD